MCVYTKTMIAWFFPAVCSIEHLELIINEVIGTKSNSSLIEIPPNACQYEENPSNLMTIDLIAMWISSSKHVPLLIFHSVLNNNFHFSFLLYNVTSGLFGIIFIFMVTSTGYDIFCTITNRMCLLLQSINRVHRIYREHIIFNSRKWVSVIFGIFHTYKWNEIVFDWKFQTIESYWMLEWNSGHDSYLRYMCAYSYVFYKYSNSKSSNNV